MKRAIPTILFAAMAAACGGGGGGGNDGINPPLPPTNDDTFGTLAINNATVDVLPLAIGGAEGILQLAQSFINAVLRYQSQSGTTITDCDNFGGTRTITHGDNDNNLSISMGDTITIEYSACDDRIINDVVTGVMQVDVVSSVFSSDNLALSGKLMVQPGFLIDSSLTHGSASISVDGEYELSYALNTLDQLSVTTSGTQFVDITIAGIVERFTAFSITKTATIPMPGSLTVSTDVSLSLRYESGLLGGDATCSAANLNFLSSSTPVAGQVECKGRNSSAVRILGQTVQLDEDGDGSFITLGVVSWSDFSEGFFPMGSSNDFSLYAAELPSVWFAIDNRDVLYDQQRNRALIATGADDPFDPNALVAIDTATRARERLLTFPETPLLLRLSPDSSRLYVAFANPGSPVRRYNADTLELETEIAITPDVTFSDTAIVLDMDVSPLRSDLVAIAVRVFNFGEGNVVIADGSNQLPDSLRDFASRPSPSALPEVEFRSDGQRVIVGGGTSGALTLGPNGVAAIDEGFLSGGPLERIGNRIYTGSLVLDETTSIRVGSYTNGTATYATDTVNDFMYITISNDFWVYSLSRYTFVAEYDLNFGGYADLRQIVPAGPLLLLAGQNRIDIVDPGDIEPDVTSDCGLTELVTDDDEAYSQIQCRIASAVFDPLRNKVYATVGSGLAVNGNSVAVIDPETPAIDSYVFVGAEPDNLTISGDGNTLFVDFNGADQIAVVDLNTLTVSGYLDIDLAPDTGSAPLRRRRHSLDIVASPIENEGFAMALGEPTSVPFEEMIWYQDGTLRPNRVDDDEMISDVSSSQTTTLGFDQSGLIYSIGVEYSRDEIRFDELSVGPAGIDLVGSFIFSNTLLNAEASVTGGMAYLGNGHVIDLAMRTDESRFTVGTDVRAVLADPINDEVFFLSPDSTGNINVTVQRYDRVSGSLLGQQNFEGYIGSFRRDRSFFAIGNDKLGIVVEPFGEFGMLIIDRASVQ